jgi:hypothetical protein
MAGLQSVHALYPLRIASVWLKPGSYCIDEDPDAFDFPVSLSELTITGPDGLVRATQTPYDISPADLGGLLLGVGMYVQADRFKVTRGGVYHFSVTDPEGGSPLFVSEPYSASARRTGPWALLIIAALITLARTALRLRSRRRRQGRHRVPVTGRAPVTQGPSQGRGPVSQEGQAGKSGAWPGGSPYGFRKE